MQSDTINLGVLSTDPNHERLCNNNMPTNNRIDGPTCLSDEMPSRTLDLQFSSKGLHFYNLNIRYLVPKLDELRLAMATERCPDILGVCKTFLEPNISDSQVIIDGYSMLRKDRSDTQNKSGGGLVLYHRNTLNRRRRPELEASNTETLWSELTLPNSRPFLICTVYRPPSAKSE